MGVQFSVDLCNWNTTATSCVWLVALGMSEGQNKKSHQKSFVPILVFYGPVWNVEVCSIYSYWLAVLTSMHKFNLTVLSLRSFLTSSWSWALIDIPVCSNRLVRLWAITREQPNIFAAHITLGTATTCQKPSYAYFDVVALVQYTWRTLFVVYRCSDLLDSWIVCLHTQTIVMIIFQT